jgi:acetyltransferase-like isoleucine patch superfamily enzyme
MLLRVVLAVRRARGRVRAESGVRLGRGVRFDIARGGQVTLGHGCEIGAGSRFHVTGRVRVGPGARLGERCVIVAHERVDIGPDALLGDEVVLVDFDHDVSDVERPIRLQGVLTAPVVVGERAALAAGAAVLRGVAVGAGARVMPRSVVTRDVAPGAAVAGVPARRVRREPTAGP